MLSRQQSKGAQMEEFGKNEDPKVRVRGGTCQHLYLCGRHRSIICQQYRIVVLQFSRACIFASSYLCMIVI